MSEEVSALASRLRTIIDNMVAGLIVVTRDGYIESINLATERMLSYSPEELVGLHISVVFTNGKLDLAFMTQLQEKSSNKLCSIELRRKDGSCIPVVVSMSDFITEFGKDRSLLCILEATNCFDFS